MGRPQRTRRNRRALQFSQCVALSVCILGTLGVLIFAGSARAYTADSGTSLQAQDIVQRMLEDVSFEQVMESSGYVAVSSATIPEWFSDEIVSADCIEEGWADASWLAAMLLVPNSACNEISELFKQKGWEVACINNQGVMSLVKNSGQCKWMTASVAKAKAGWEVVLHIQRFSSAPIITRGTGSGS